MSFEESDLEFFIIENIEKKYPQIKQLKEYDQLICDPKNLLKNLVKIKKIIDKIINSEIKQKVKEFKKVNPDINDWTIEDYIGKSI